MYRFVENRLQEWMNTSDKSLLITGARQVGKTYVVRKFLHDNNISFFEINFIERPDILESIKSCNDIKEMVLKFKLLSPDELEEGKSVIFLDEIQKFPEIVTKIKFLVDDGSFRYILTGSLLGVELNNIESVPVGYMEEIKMYPLNLFEFCLALGERKETLDYLYNCYKNKEKIDNVIHEKMISYFYYYLISGGMPNVVNSFIEFHNLNNLDMNQKNIINFYKKDFTQYENVDKKLKLISIYDNVPSQLNKQNNKFIFSYLDKELKFDRYENSFLWLSNAGVVIPTYIVDDLKSPLITSKSKNTFKLFLSDVGLLTSCYPSFVKLEILNKNKDKEINNGALFENFVAEELNTNDLDVYYYKSSKIGEIDFIVEVNGGILPIEVKSGKDYKNHKALNNLINNYKSRMLKPIVLSLNNIEVTDSIDYIPIYLTGFIKEEPCLNIKLDLDLLNLN